MFEGLYALDAKYQPVPLLAEGHEVLDGGKRYAIRLRKDVKFHNGKALTSADVVASLQRWGATGRHRQGRLQDRRGGGGQGPERGRDPAQGAVGQPADGAGQVDNAAVHLSQGGHRRDRRGPAQGVRRHRAVQFVEHKPDRHVKLARFDGYVAARARPPSGLAGRRTA